MRLAIMQPYLFPYLGYFQLMAAVDRFVLYDDVAFIKNGWVNRNRVLLDGQVHYLTVPVRAGMGVPIREVAVDPQPNLLRKLRARLEHGYRKAPFLREGLAAFDEALADVAAGRPATIGDVARRSILAVAARLGLRTTVVPSSAAYGNAELKGVDRVLDICRREGATQYCNAPGGRELYAPEPFSAAGLELRFLKPALPPYPQPGTPAFVPGLSILDVVMNNGLDETRALAQGGELLP